ncbi:AraC family transcriptional regulator [Idiomarina xiamenensis]|nr:AraC family transcriptional regulator [Idiomarina xiamenensis]
MIVQNAVPDPLSDVLALAGLNASCSVRLYAGGDWALRFHPIELKFNTVRHGECWLRIPGMPPYYLRKGDCFIVCRTPFVLASDAHIEAIDAAEIFAQPTTSLTVGAGDTVALLGGSVALENSGADGLLELLPPVIVINAELDRASSFAWLLDQLDNEWRSSQAGSYAVCNELLKIIFVHSLRQYMGTANLADIAWLGGLQDPVIAKVMSAIHASPTKSWRLIDMAKIACMSRSSFAALFKAKVGKAPIEYASWWRMQIAASRLKNGVDSVGQTAASLGYLSDAAFGVAFKRMHGKSPGQYRREANSRPSG